MMAPFIHARWLNSLSYLEYRGFRKIVRSQSTEQMCLETLTHTLEEVRHALFFKRQAVKIGGEAFRFYNDATLLCPKALKLYFYDLDSEVANLLRSSGTATTARHAYYVVTRLVEVRALALYNEYQLLLEKESHGFSLSGLLKEESQHLQMILAQSGSILESSPITPARLTEIEERHFSIFWQQIDEAVTIQGAKFFSTLGFA